MAYVEESVENMAPYDRPMQWSAMVSDDATDTLGRYQSSLDSI